MKSIWKFIIVILSIFIYFDLAYADKFNVRGYQQGMSRQEVKKYAMKHDHIFKLDDKHPNLVEIYQGNYVLVYLELRNNKVYKAFWTTTGKIDKFIKQLEYLTKQGMLKKDVSWSSMICYDGKELFNLTVYFVNPDSETDYYVTVMLFAFENDGTSSYQVTYEGK